MQARPADPAPSRDTPPPPGPALPLRGPQSGPPSGGHGAEHQSAARAPRARGRGQNSGSTPVYWLSARAALRRPPLPGPDSTERNAPGALYCAAAAGSRGRGLARPWPACPLGATHTQIPAADQSRGCLNAEPPAPFPRPTPFLACVRRRISPKSFATRFHTHLEGESVCARVGAALSGKEKGERPWFKDTRPWGRGLEKLSADPFPPHPASCQKVAPGPHSAIRSSSGFQGEGFPRVVLPAPRDGGGGLGDPGRVWGRRAAKLRK